MAEGQEIYIYRSLCSEHAEWVQLKTLDLCKIAENLDVVPPKNFVPPKKNSQLKLIFF
jgi:hypothetical protein